MPRPKRHAVADVDYHVLNRGNDRKVVFADLEDYQRFRHLMIEGAKRYPILIWAHVLMVNHFHLLLRNLEEGAVSSYMQWVTGEYAREHRARMGTVGHGHVFQRRFWNHPIEGWGHFITVMKYIEANPLRAGLVSRAEAWRWSSLHERLNGMTDLLQTLPMNLPPDWIAYVNLGQDHAILERIRRDLVPRRGSRRHRG